MSSGAPCGACKFLRRKCVRDCPFAPYFGSEQGAARFAAVHKIFGASNVSKLLRGIDVSKRCDAVLTISYEAQARISDPVYGCVSTIFALQQQVAALQNELNLIQRHLAASSRQLAVTMHHQQHHATPALFSTPGTPVLPFETPLVDHMQHVHPSLVIRSATSEVGSTYGRMKVEEKERFDGVPFDMGVATASVITDQMQHGSINVAENCHDPDDEEADPALQLQAFEHALFHSK